MKQNCLKRIILYMICIFSAIAFSACGAPGETKKDETAISCTVSVSCEEVLRHMEELKEEKKALVPQDGIILPETEIKCTENNTALELLQQELKKQKIHFDLSGAYIKGIANIYEKDCGAYSGWIYTVNGEYVEVGAEAYRPKDGDVIEWSYMTGLE